MKKILSLIFALSFIIPSISFAGSFADSPFANIYNSDTKCWRDVVYVHGPSEQVLRNDIKGYAREKYAKATGTEASALPSYAPFMIETSNPAKYDPVAKEYHFFGAFVYPMPGISADCIAAVPQQNPETTVTPEGQDLISKSAVGQAAASSGAGSGSGSGSSNSSTTNPGSGNSSNSNTNNSNSSTYKPGPSGLAADCNRGSIIKKVFIGSNGLEQNEFGFQNDCGFDDLMGLINKVINFLLFVIATPLVAIGLCYAGFLYISSGGSSEKVGQAKSILINLVVGYIVALIAWVVVKTIMVSLGFDSTGIFLEI